MSDTVLIALITFASGFLGVVVGAVANYKVSALNVKAERGKLLHDEKKTAYTEAVSAYLATLDFVAAHDEDSWNEGELIGAARRFLYAQAAVALIAPKSVQQALSQATETVQKMTTTWKTPDTPEVFELLTGTMREDLLAFSAGAEKE